MPKAKSKSTTKKTKSSSKSKSLSKKSNSANKSSAKITTDQASVAAMDYRDLFFGTLAAISTYIFALWAIDSGSLWVYALTFAALYYTIHFYRLFIGNKFFNNDKRSKAK